jgi:hypothetical protein
MSNRTYRQAFAEWATLSVDLLRSRPDQLARRIVDAIDDGTGAVTTDSDQVTGGGATSSTTERLAMRSMPDELGRTRPDQARVDAMTWLYVPNFPPCTSVPAYGGFELAAARRARSPHRGSR